MTATFAQTESDRKLCLTYPEFEYYADACIERNSLKIDTAILNAKVIAIAEIVSFKNEQIDDLRQISANKDTIIGRWEQSFDKLEKRCIKAEKRAKIAKKAMFIFMFTTALLSTIVLLK